jgi:glyoxylase-like metal-dependent hydrolase (beta-lactamase superfamily II)
VSSYYCEPEKILIDPMVPAEGIAWFDERGTPEHVLLTNRHHDRDAWRLREAFGCEVHCIKNGLHELDGRGPVVSFDFGDLLPGGVVAHEIGGISPDETALYVPSRRALACADGVVRLTDGAALEFVPDDLMDEPEETKRRLRAAYQRLLDDDAVEFDYLLLAHGDPIVDGAEEALRAFAAAG